MSTEDILEEYVENLDDLYSVEESDYAEVRERYREDISEEESTDVLW